MAKKKMMSDVGRVWVYRAETSKGLHRRMDHFEGVKSCKMCYNE